MRKYIFLVFILLFLSCEREDVKPSNYETKNYKNMSLETALQDLGRNKPEVKSLINLLIDQVEAGNIAGGGTNLPAGEEIATGRTYAQQNGDIKPTYLYMTPDVAIPALTAGDPPANEAINFASLNIEEVVTSSGQLFEANGQQVYANNFLYPSVQGGTNLRADIFSFMANKFGGEFLFVNWDITGNTSFTTTAKIARGIIEYTKTTDAPL